MIGSVSFPEKVLGSFKNITREISKGSSEHDVRYRFVKYFVEGALGYEPKYIKWEKKRADLTIVDENDFAVIKIETKRPTEDIEKTQHEEQAFKYEEESTRYIGLTNFLQFKVWEIKKTGNELRVNLDFSKILEEKKNADQLSSEEKTQILFLYNLTKETIFDPSKYERFDEFYARIDITKDVGFGKLLDRLNYIANTLLLGYTLKTFGEYKEGYGRYLAELTAAERESKNNKGNQELNHNIAKYKQKLEQKYEKYKTFSGYYLWKEYAGKEDVSDDEIKEIFCKETISVFLNKLLVLRICEDKGFLEKNISNGGIEELRTVLKKRFAQDTLNKEILKIAFESAKGFYSHFYETGILDWFRTGDGEFNEILNRVLWIFNQFDFTHVDRDILGNLYEKYLPSKERKRLGEFYTPTEVIDYILTSVGYTYSHDIETKDILDPACGSGGFLVRATRRLISRYLMKFGKTDKSELRNPKNWREIVARLSPDEAKIILEAVQEHIYGLDINPFACHIAEMNVLFQVIDLYQKTREKYKDYKFSRFKIYRTDSLEKSIQKQILDYSYAAFLEEQEEIDAIKQKKFDFIVGNPPYVRVQLINERDKTSYENNFSSATGLYDLSVLFIERGLAWLKHEGKIGYITSNKFMNRKYGEGVRKYILENADILRIVDFGDSGVFKDVTNYPCVIIFSRIKGLPKEKKNIHCVLVHKSKDNILKEEHFHKFKEEFSSEDYSSFLYPRERLTIDFWRMMPAKDQTIIDKIKKSSSRTLGEISEGVRVGVQTGANKFFILDEKTIKSYKLEHNILKKFLLGRDARRWRILWKGKYLIYPYEKQDKEMNLIDENTMKNKYSNTYEYLKQYKEELTKRWGIKTWYELPTFRNPEWFEQPKILTPGLSDKNNFVFDEVGYFFPKGGGDIYGFTLKNGQRNDYLYLSGILNSNTIEYIIKHGSSIFSGKFYEYSTEYLEKLPIKLPETSDEKKLANQITKKVDEILELHKLGIVDIDAILEGEETEKICNLPKVAFSIKDDTQFDKIKVKDDQIYINSQDFIEVKDKKIREYVEIFLNCNSEKFSKLKDVKTVILNIPVPKSDEIIKEIIKKGSVDYTKNKGKIQKLEEEINGLVYELYGLNKKEIAIIERNQESTELE